MRSIYTQTDLALNIVYTLIHYILNSHHRQSSGSMTQNRTFKYQQWILYKGSNLQFKYFDNFFLINCAGYVILYSPWEGGPPQQQALEVPALYRGVVLLNRHKIQLISFHTLQLFFPKIENKGSCYPE